MAIFNPSLVKTSDITEVQDALRSILKTRFPDLDTSSGSVTDSILIQGTSYLAAMFMAEAEDVRTRLSVTGLLERSDVSGVRAVEDLASNWLVDLRSSNNARGIITIELSSPATFTIPANIVFSRGAEGLTAGLANQSESILVVPEDFIEVISSSGTSVFRYNISAINTGVTPESTLSPGSFTTSYAIPNIVSIFNQSSFIAPIASSTEDAYTRIKNSVTKRGFSTFYSSKTTVLEANIATVRNCVPVGAGDLEMGRDTNRIISSIPIHTLGMSNIVISERENPTVVTYQQFNSSSLAFNAVNSVFNGAEPVSIVSFFPRAVTGFTKVKRTSSQTTLGQIEVSQVNSSTLLNGEVSFQLASSNQLYWNSVYSNGISSTSRLPLTKLLSTAEPTSIVINATPSVALTQQLIDTDAYRPMGISVQAQAANFVSVKPSAIKLYKSSTTQTSDISVQSVKSLVYNLITTWSGDSSPLSITEIVSNISALLSGLVSSVSFVDGISFIVHLPDGSELPYKSLVSINIEEVSNQLLDRKLTLEKLYELQVSNRTSTLSVLSDDIIVEIV